MFFCMYLCVFHEFLSMQKYFLFFDIGSDTVEQCWPFVEYFYRNFGSLLSWCFEAGIGTLTSSFVSLYGLLCPLNLPLMLSSSAVRPYMFINAFLRIFLVLSNFGSDTIEKIWSCMENFVSEIKSGFPDRLRVNVRWRTSLRYWSGGTSLITQVAIRPLATASFRALRKDSVNR